MIKKTPKPAALLVAIAFIVALNGCKGSMAYYDALPPEKIDELWDDEVIEGWLAIETLNLQRGKPYAANKYSQALWEDKWFSEEEWQDVQDRKLRVGQREFVAQMVCRSLNGKKFEWSGATNGKVITIHRKNLYFRDGRLVSWSDTNY